jgi:hypothetical protein
VLSGLKMLFGFTKKNETEPLTYVGVYWLENQGLFVIGKNDYGDVWADFRQIDQNEVELANAINDVFSLKGSLHQQKTGTKLGDSFLNKHRADPARNSTKTVAIFRSVFVEMKLL